jgi:hypothetical protein|nr:hypothetical protein [Aeromicrobium sp.]
MHGTAFPEELLTYLSIVSTAFVPGGASYPPGGEAQVDTFIEQRATAEDLAAFLDLMTRYPATTVEEATSRISEMESGEPLAFAWLREFIYHGYYASHRTLAAMADRGYEYHGAPQPLGYRIREQMRTPTAVRGSYISTEEVRRATS